MWSICKKIAIVIVETHADLTFNYCNIHIRLSASLAVLFDTLNLKCWLPSYPFTWADRATRGLRGLYTFRTQNGVIYIKTLICIPMYTLEYDVSEKSKQFEIDQSAIMKMGAILDFVSITGIFVSNRPTTQHRNTVFSAPLFRKRHSVHWNRICIPFFKIKFFLMLNICYRNIRIYDYFKTAQNSQITLYH